MDKQARDALRNAEINDTYIHASQEPWLPFSDGIDFKVMRVSPDSGAWTTLFKCAKGSGFSRHKHLGSGEYYMISGKMEIRGGVENGGITAVPGDYGFEPNGVIHDWTSFPEESELYFTNFGPIQFIDDDDNIVFVLDWQGILEMEAQARDKLEAAE